MSSATSSGQYMNRGGLFSGGMYNQDQSMEPSGTTAVERKLLQFVSSRNISNLPHKVG